MKRKLMNRTTLAIICAMSALCAVGAAQKPTAKKTSFSESELRALAKSAPDVKNAGQLYSVALATSNDADRQQAYLKASAAGLIACGKTDIYKKHIKGKLQNVAEFEDGLKDDCKQCSGNGTKDQRCLTCRGNGKCPSCKGTGQIMTTVSLSFDKQSKPCGKCNESGRCPKCDGEGSTMEKCFACAGTGKVFSKSVAARVFRNSCNAIADGVGIVAPQNKTKNNSEVNVKPEVAGKAVGSKEGQSDVTKSQTTRRRRRESGERNIPKQDGGDDVSTDAKSKLAKNGEQNQSLLLGTEKEAKARAKYDLGLLYSEGTERFPQDKKTAAKLFLEAAELGHIKAHFSLGACYYNGDGVQQDKVEAVKWFRKAAELGDAESQYTLGMCYTDGVGVPQDEMESVKWYRKAAEQEYAEAQFNLGCCYRDGIGVTQDKVEAAKWYLKAAKQGYVKAQNNVGNLYAHGVGVLQDKTEAAKWYRKAAEQGYAEAQYNLGVCFIKGNGVPQDETEAVKWFRKAAEQGQANAQYNLGIHYYMGGVEKQDIAEAAKWFRRAAEQGNAKAQYILGVSLVNGQGVEQDEVEALKWIRKAAEQGISEAQYVLGACYQNGIVADKNITEAVKWYRKAAAQGHKKAMTALLKLSDEL